MIKPFLRGIQFSLVGRLVKDPLRQVVKTVVGFAVFLLERRDDIQFVPADSLFAGSRLDVGIHHGFLLLPVLAELLPFRSQSVLRV